ncbi:hypothetical protein Ancab_001739 [Ancistrocladus abbreviatus]
MNILMAIMNMKTTLTLAIISPFWALSMAQSSATCNNVLITLSPCLNYISGNSSTPSSSCCSQLASVAKSQPECLCQVIKGSGSSLGVSINETQALNLPSACNVQTPSVSRCSGASSPTGSSAVGSVPTSSDGASQTGALTTKAAAAAAANVSSSNVNAVKSQLPLSLTLLFIASYGLLQGLHEL